MEQKFIKIGEVKVPIIVDNAQEWFPVSYITTKVLFRSGKNGLINNHNKNKFNLRKYIITFGDKNVHETNCIAKQELIEILKLTHAGRLSSDQRISQNKIHTYLGIDLLPEEEIDTKEYKDEWFNEVDEYTKDVIKNEFKTVNVKWIRLCTKCLCHYPLTNKFFAIDKRYDKGYVKTCRVCLGIQEFFRHSDTTMNQIMKVEKSLIDSMNDNQIMPIYYAYKDGKIKRLPDCYENKESYLEIIKELYTIGELNVNNLTISYIVHECALSNIRKYMNIVDVYHFLFGSDFYLYSWKYPKFTFQSMKLTYDIANKILHNYTKENKIFIENKFIYDYDYLFKQCGLKNITNSDRLGFVVQFYKRKYAGYLFKINGNNYYRNENNILFDLRYLIEKDMKLDINKIPLYLTKNTLRKRCSSLYRVIVTNKNGSIFEWVNRLYPDQFIEADFEINPYRNEFDSDTEMYIHELLVDEFDSNVIYNQRNNRDTIKLKGKVPDWFVFTDSGVWVVEYFGLMDERYYENSRVKDYKEKTENKISLYENTNGYKFLYLYPSDVDDNFKGCREKIENMKKTIDT